MDNLAVLKGQFSELRSRSYLLHLELQENPERATDVSVRLESLEHEAIKLMKKMMEVNHLMYGCDSDS